MKANFVLMLLPYIFMPILYKRIDIHAKRYKIIFSSFIDSYCSFTQYFFMHMFNIQNLCYLPLKGFQCCSALQPITAKKYFRLILFLKIEIQSVWYHCSTLVPREKKRLHLSNWNPEVIVASKNKQEQKSREQEKLFIIKKWCAHARIFCHWLWYFFIWEDQDQNPSRAVIALNVLQVITNTKDSSLLVYDRIDNGNNYNSQS